MSRLVRMLGNESDRELVFAAAAALDVGLGELLGASFVADDGLVKRVLSDSRAPLTPAESQSFLDEATNTGVNYNTNP